MSATTETSLQEIAKEYQRLGLCTLPVRAKQPVVPWRTFVERFPTAEEWRSFPWHEATGLALVIGPSTWQLWPNLWCLDVESEHRSSAEHWLSQHAPDWRSGAVVETGSGGLHIYFLADSPVRTKPIPWGEVRGQASICVLPPSRHPETGRSYQWLSQRWTNLPSLNPAQVPGFGGLNGHRPWRRLLSETIPVGSRHDTMVRTAGLLRGELHLEPEEILRVLEAVNKRCEVPLPNDELRAIANSTTHWQVNPRLIIRDRRSVPPRTPVTFAGRQPPPPREWLVADVVPANLPVMLYGAGGSAKSYLVLLLGLCVASGLPWLGKSTLRRPVLYADFELDESEHHRRAIRLAAGLGLPDVPTDFYYVSLADLRPEDADAVLARWIADHPGGLIVIDSLGPAAVEIEHEKALPVVQLFQRLRLLNPGGLVLIDHQSKLQAGQDYREKAPFGSVYKFNLSRVIWQVECVTSQPGEAWLIVRNTKNNLGPLQGEIGVKLAFEEERIEASVVPVTSSVLLERASLESRILATLEAHGPLTAQEIADQLEANPGSVKAKLSRLKGLGRVQVVGTVGREYLWSLPDQSDDPSLTLTTYMGVNVNDDPENGDFRYIPLPDAKNGACNETPSCNESPRPGEFRYNPHRDADCNESPGQFVSPTENSSVGETKTTDPDFRYIPHHDAECNESPSCNESPCNGTPSCNESRPCNESPCNETPPLSCEVCGARLAWCGTGRPPRYCSSACRVRGHRLRTADQGTSGDKTPDHEPRSTSGDALPTHQSNLVTADHEAVPGHEDPGPITSDEGPRCPVCRSVYELRTTDRPGWLQIRCKCRPPGEWWWTRTDALGRKGVAQSDSK